MHGYTNTAINNVSLLYWLKMIRICVAHSWYAHKMVHTMQKSDYNSKDIKVTVTLQAVGNHETCKSILSLADTNDWTLSF